jgi:hypothetical protein
MFRDEPWQALGEERGYALLNFGRSKTTAGPRLVSIGQPHYGSSFLTLFATNTSPLYRPSAIPARIPGIGVIISRLLLHYKFAARRAASTDLKGFLACLSR